MECFTSGTVCKSFNSEFLDFIPCSRNWRRLANLDHDYLFTGICQVIGTLFFWYKKQLLLIVVNGENAICQCDSYYNYIMMLCCHSPAEAPNALHGWYQCFISPCSLCRLQDSPLPLIFQLGSLRRTLASEEDWETSPRTGLKWNTFRFMSLCSVVSKLNVRTHTHTHTHTHDPLTHFN